MPTLDWIGKKAVENHLRDVPFRLLEDVPELSAGDPGCGNLLVQGDNLEALKALLPYYAKQVKCIYIDPPYNTGNEGWVYNDAVNSPEMREWLGKVVGKEAEDLSRHDKWLCMIYPRLALAKEFVSKDGLILVSIDDNELHHLRVVMDELFGSENRLACFPWRTEGNFDNQAKVKINHEYVLAYARHLPSFPHPPVVDPSTAEDSKLYRDHIRNTITKNGPKNPVSDVLLPAGFPADFPEGTIPARSDAWPHYKSSILVKDGQLAHPVVARSGWSSKRILEKFIASGFRPVPDSKGQQTTFLLSKKGAIENVKVRERQSHVVSYLGGMGSTQEASAALSELGLKFSYPKPVTLLAYLLSLVAGRNHIVLDFFAGSGSTAEAVVALNRADGGERQFVLVEIDEAIVRDVTVRRLQSLDSAMLGTANTGKNVISPTAFRLARLGRPLFSPEGQIADHVPYADLARHIYFVETGEPLPGGVATNPPQLGVVRGTAIYMLYNGIPKDKHPCRGNVLTRAILNDLPPHDGPRVVYGTACRISQGKLREIGVTFRQIPHHVKAD